MSLLFAAIGATVTALVEVTLGPYIEVAGVAPHPVLVGGVIWTIAAGIDRGITWAFVGGLVLDSLLGRPLGVSAFALLVSVGGAALIAQPFPRLRLVAPVVAVPFLSIVNSLLIMSLTAAARPGADFSDPMSLLLPGAIYDAVIGMFVGPLAVTFHDRRTATERLDW
jgi:rod shape-determining protein MreD